MKKVITAVVLATYLSCPLVVSTQGSLYVSNLEQTPSGNGAIGSDHSIAQVFRIQASDTNLYRLDSVDLLMNPTSGVASNFEVAVYSAPVGLAPQDYLGSLAGSTDPSTGGTYGYAASGIALSAGNHYFVVATSSTPIAQGAYNWSASEGVTQSGSWVILNQYFTSSDSSSWELRVRQEVFQLALYATVVPESTTSVLLGFGLGIVVMMRMFPRTRSRFS